MAKPRKTTPTQSKPPVPPSKTPLIVGGLVIVAILAAVALLATSPWDDGEDTVDGPEPVQFQPVTATGTNLSPLPNNGADPAINQPAPELRGRSFTGEPIEVVRDGKARMVMFFAHWCPHCQKELPEIADWISSNEKKYDVQFVAVSTSARPGQAKYPPSDWFADEDYPLPVLADDNSASAAKAYGVQSFPYLVAVDAAGSVVQRSSGELSTSDFEAMVAKAAGK